MGYPTTDELFNKEAYENAGMQPSVGTRGTIPLQQAKTPFQSTRVTHVDRRKGTNQSRQVGSKMMKAGSALSRTGAGAIVGVPLLAAGAALRGKNVDTNTNDKSRTSRNFKRFGNSNLSNLKQGIEGKLAATRVNMTAFSFATPLWFTVQLPIALFSLVVLGIAAAGNAVAEQLFGGPILSVIFGIIDSLTNATQTWEAFGLALYGGLMMLVFFVGIVTLGFMTAMYTFSGVRCFFGEHAAVKCGFFIFALLGYLMPLLNLFPWFMLWGIVVWRYPK